MKGHGGENADVQPVEEWKVLRKSPGIQLVSVKEGVEYHLTEAFRVVIGVVGEGGGIESGHEAVGTIGLGGAVEDVVDVVDVSVREPVC